MEARFESGAPRAPSATETEKPSRIVPAVAETQSITEVRGEVSDPDRQIAFAETHSMTKVKGEADDRDRGTFGGDLEWRRGDRRPLLFRHAVTVTAEAPVFGYNDNLDMAVNEDGRPLIESGIAPETGTETAVRTEATDPDR